jgi:hypothetical protein
MTLPTTVKTVSLHGNGIGNNWRFEDVGLDVAKNVAHRSVQCFCFPSSKSCTGAAFAHRTDPPPPC